MTVRSAFSIVCIETPAKLVDLLLKVF
jgi:hypothetical protein